MNKFVIRFFGSGVYPEYTGIVASIEINAQDEYCAKEIAKKMLSNYPSYYTDRYDVVKVDEPSNRHDSLLW